MANEAPIRLDPRALAATLLAQHEPGRAAVVAMREAAICNAEGDQAGRDRWEAAFRLLMTPASKEG